MAVGLFIGTWWSLVALTGTGSEHEPELLVKDRCVRSFGPRIGVAIYDDRAALEDRPKNSEVTPMALKRKTLVAVIVVPVQVVLAVLAWRDLARRGDDQVRGSKRAWRVFVSMNPGNALIYWVFGRRSVPPALREGGA